MALRARALGRAARQHARSGSSFTAAAAVETRRPSPRPKPDLGSPSLPFGRIFSDHQLEIRWTLEGGWQAPELCPQRDIPTHPASLGINHGVACFEGMKAFAGADGQVRLFRPELNMARLLRSATRLQLPAFEPAELQQLLARLISIDAAWCPTAPGSSLYIRPVVTATNGTIGFKVEEAMLTAVLAPSGSFFGTPQPLPHYLAHL